jgi:hypothetical protein
LISDLEPCQHLQHSFPEHDCSEEYPEVADDEPFEEFADHLGIADHHEYFRDIVRRRICDDFEGFDVLRFELLKETLGLSGSSIQR